MKALFPPEGKHMAKRSSAYLLGNSGDESGWPGRGNEGESVSCRAGGVRCWTQRQPHFDANQRSDKEGRVMVGGGEEEKKH